MSTLVGSSRLLQGAVPGTVAADRRAGSRAYAASPAAAVMPRQAAMPKQTV